MTENEWHCNNFVLNLDQPVISGILNLTSDSFWSGSRVGSNMEMLLNRAEEMVEAGARILDLGAESTRPGANAISTHQQIALLAPAIKLLRAQFPSQNDILISVDCNQNDVAKACIDAGADIINDISGLQWENNVLPTLMTSSCGYVLMHILGTPQNMQQNPQYKNVVSDIHQFFLDKLKYLEVNEVHLARVVLDPGIGFGKTVEHNLQLIANSNKLSTNNRPLYFGVSRKSFIGKLLGVDTEDRLTGTTVIQTLLLAMGTKILRVHDVKEAVETVKMWNAVRVNLQN